MIIHVYLAADSLRCNISLYIELHFGLEVLFYVRTDDGCESVASLPSWTMDIGNNQHVLLSERLSIYIHTYR